MTALARFGEALRVRRTTLPPPLNTQAGLAAHLGVTQAAVSAWEGGKAWPSAPTLLKLMKLADLDASTFETVTPQGA